MMKTILFIIGAFLIYSSSFSMPNDSERVIRLKGMYGIVAPNSVQVTIGKNHTLTTTFYKDMDNVTVTVKKKSGEVVSVENIDAKEWDNYPTTIPNYKEGEYIIEISTPAGELIGSF